MGARKIINFPRPSVELAEWFGIVLGDGGITKYQITVSFNATDDSEYFEYVKRLVYRLFRVRPLERYRETHNCSEIIISSVELVDAMVRAGLHVGSKKRSLSKIPDWILGNRHFALACVRGLFDTDGCIYAEKHYYKERIYIYPRMSFVSAISSLREDFSGVLSSERLLSRSRSSRAVTLERFTDIQKYFKIIGSHNPKHVRRYEQFGGVG